MLAFSLLYKGTAYFLEWTLITIAHLDIEFRIIIDPLRLSFFASVAWISASVLSFAKSYIRAEVYPLRFTLLVLRFVGSIFLLIFRPNIVRVLLGWDGLGVTSYLLVIYYQSTKSYNAGLLTALTNRLGDVGILLTIALLVELTRWNFALWRFQGSSLTLSWAIAIVAVSAMTKRAQIPFSAWLPAAIAAPTPVSALVHSSTLVTAGVYLLIRFNLVLRQSYWTSILLFSGAITILIAGLRAIFEIDIKKIVALSTLSQLGLMISALGIGCPEIAFFHLLSHAYFKALLFMCAGNLIHCRNDFQDLRQIGSNFDALPLTTAFINLSNLSLCGFPFIAGFYSKDIFLETSLLTSTNFLAVILFFIATLFTAAYSVRFTLITSIREPAVYRILWSNDEDYIILRGNWALAPLAITGGCLLRWALFPTPGLVALPLILKTGAFLVSLSGLVLALRIRQFKAQSSFSFALGLIWNLPLIRGRLPSFSGLGLSRILTRLGDKGWFFSAYHIKPFSFTSSSGSNFRLKESSLYPTILTLSLCWITLLVFLVLTWLYLRILLLALC